MILYIKHPIQNVLRLHDQDFKLEFRAYPNTSYPERLFITVLNEDIVPILVIELSAFPCNCGIAILGSLNISELLGYNKFDFAVEILPYILEFLRESEYTEVIYTTVLHQDLTIKILEKVGFEAIKSFKSNRTKNYNTVWVYDMEDK